MSTLEVWYAHLDMDELLPRFHSSLDRKQTPGVWKAIVKARAHDSVQAFAKLAESCRRRMQDPPSASARSCPSKRSSRGSSTRSSWRRSDAFIRSYRDTLRADRRRLLEQYRFVHLARKVVGVGSVGTKPGSCCSSTIRSPVVLAGEGGRGLRARGVHLEKRILQPRSARRGWAAADAGGQRHLPRLGPIRLAGRGA